MKNCLKYITLLTLVTFTSPPAYAGGKFMPIKPMEHTLINGKKFIGLGGGQDPIKLAALKQDYFNLRSQPKPIAPRMSGPRKEKLEETETTMPEPETTLPTAEETEEKLVEDLEENPVTNEAMQEVIPSYNPEHQSLADKILPWNKPVQHLWPIDETVKSRISSPFGYRKHPITGRHSFHAGMDIAAPKGTAVIASCHGEVTDLGHHKNLGKFVKVTHRDGTYSLYGHLSAITAKIGHEVAQGQKIGEVGSTGRSTGPHLDYSLRRDGEPMNPAKFLKRRNSQQVAFAH